MLEVITLQKIRREQVSRTTLLKRLRDLQLLHKMQRSRSVLLRKE